MTLELGLITVEVEDSLSSGCWEGVGRLIRSRLRVHKTKKSSQLISAPQKDYNVEKWDWDLKEQPQGRGQILEAYDEEAMSPES